MAKEFVRKINKTSDKEPLYTSQSGDFIVDEKNTEAYMHVGNYYLPLGTSIHLEDHTLSYLTPTFDQENGIIQLNGIDNNGNNISLTYDTSTLSHTLDPNAHDGQVSLVYDENTGKVTYYTFQKNATGQLEPVKQFDWDAKGGSGGTKVHYINNGIDTVAGDLTINHDSITNETGRIIAPITTVDNELGVVGTNISLNAYDENDLNHTTPLQSNVATMNLNIKVVRTNTGTRLNQIIYYGTIKANNTSFEKRYIKLWSQQLVNTIKTYSKYYGCYGETRFTELSKDINNRDNYIFQINSLNVSDTNNLATIYVDTSNMTLDDSKYGFQLIVMNVDDNT